MLSSFKRLNYRNCGFTQFFTPTVNIKSKKSTSLMEPQLENTHFLFFRKSRNLANIPTNITQRSTFIIVKPSTIL